MSVTELTDANFEEGIGGSLPVLVDFYATWCGPCKMIAPIVEEIATENAGKYKVCKVDTDENPRLATKYGIDRIPTLIIFKNGQAVDTIHGYNTKEILLGRLEKQNG